jgi:MSHA biogenesis protein MshJ
LLLLLSIVACCLAIGDTVWLSPAQSAQKKMAAAVARENAELETLRAQLRASAQSPPGSDPALAAREQIAKTRDLIEQVNAEIVASSAQTDQANSLPKVLVQFLRRHEGLTLVRTATLGGDAFGLKPAPTATGATGATVRRQGLELTVSGPYLELMNYVRTLEQALPTLRWGSMKLSSEKMPPQLTLQVFVVGVQP